MSKKLKGFRVYHLKLFKKDVSFGQGPDRTMREEINVAQRSQYGLQGPKSSHLFQQWQEESQHDKVSRAKEEQRRRRLVTVLATSALKRLTWMVPRRLLSNEFHASVNTIHFTFNRYLVAKFQASARDPRDEHPRSLHLHSSRSESGKTSRGSVA